MTPQEEAQELVDQFRPLFYDLKGEPELTIALSKKAARIHVEGIIEHSYQNFHKGIRTKPDVFISISDWYKTEQLHYWKSVKQSIDQTN
jgi:hypothetical protein